MHELNKLGYRRNEKGMHNFKGEIGYDSRRRNIAELNDTQIKREANNEF